MNDDCLNCNGTGITMISCCTGEVIDDEFDLCPVCYEHVGESDCEDCSGTGKSKLTIAPQHIPGVNTIANFIRDEKKY